MKSKKVAVVDRNHCVACGECTHVCRKASIRILNGCYAFADKDSCVGCGLCSKNCPAGCITIVAREENERDA